MTDIMQRGLASFGTLERYEGKILRHCGLWLMVPLGQVKTAQRSLCEGSYQSGSRLGELSVEVYVTLLAPA